MKTKSILLGVVMLILGSCIDQINPSVDEQPALANVVRFTSHEEFKAITDKIPSMTQKELDTWEKENSFVSFRTVLKQAYVEMETLTTEEEYSSFLKKYDDVLSLQDSTLTPRIDIEHLQAFVNRDGLYETSGYLHKVVGDYIITVKSNHFSELKNIKSVNSNSRLSDKIAIFKFTESERELNTNARTNSVCSVSLTDSFWLNESGCKNDREAFVRARSYQEISANTGGTYYYPRISFRVWGRYRNWLCTWKEYDTQYEYRNASYSIWAWERISMNSSASISQPKFYPVESIPDESIDDGSYGLTWDRPIGDWRFNENLATSPFTSVYIQGKSRGIGDNWITVSCP